MTHPFDPSIRFVPAKNYTWVSPTKPRTVTLLVVHSMEAPNKPTTAENVAAWFASAGAPQASAHVCIDCDSVVACVDPKDISWSCSGGNWLSYGAEFAGYAKWARSDWLSDANMPMLKLGAEHLAKAARYFGMPPVVLSEEDVGACLRDACIRQGKIPGALSGLLGGVTTHAMVNRAWRNWSEHGLPQPKGDLSHTDPGAGFPLDVLVSLMSPEQHDTDPAPPPESAA